MERLKEENIKKILVDKIKNEILGKDYDLSLVFIDKKHSGLLNSKYRKIKKPTDVLSFGLSDKMGEVFICPAVAKIKAPKFDMSFADYLLFLVIHATLHLKGMAHSSKMESYEFAYYHRYRRRHL